MTQENTSPKTNDRRSFLKGALTTGAAVAGASALVVPSLRAQGRGGLTKGDAAVLKFLAAAELIEADLWQQYAELGGVTASGYPQLGIGNVFTAAQVINASSADSALGVINTDSADPGYGIHAQTQGPNAVAVYGEADNGATAYGVEGVSTSGTGVLWNGTHRRRLWCVQRAEHDGGRIR